MYASRQTSGFRQLGRFAPVTDYSGLRPETRRQGDAEYVCALLN